MYVAVCSTACMYATARTDMAQHVQFLCPLFFAFICTPLAACSTAFGGSLCCSAFSRSLCIVGATAAFLSFAAKDCCTLHWSYQW